MRNTESSFVANIMTQTSNTRTATDNRVKASELIIAKAIFIGIVAAFAITVTLLFA